MFIHKKSSISRSLCPGIYLLLFPGLYAQELIYHHQLVELEGWLACLLCLELDGEEIAGALYGWLLTDVDEGRVEHLAAI